MRSAIRREFDRGHSFWFLVATTPLALLLAAPLPSLLAPFVATAFAYPVFFYHVRRRVHIKTAAALAVWLLVLFALVATLATLFPGFFGPPNSWMWAFLPEGGLSAGWGARLAVRVALLGGVIILALMSGGIFTLVMGAGVVMAAAIHFAEHLTLLGFYSAILTVTPWELARLVAGGGAMMAASILFYARLEGRSLPWRDAGKILLVALFLFGLDLFLEVEVAEAWERAAQAYNQVMRH